MRKRIVRLIVTALFCACAMLSLSGCIMASDAGLTTAMLAEAPDRLFYMVQSDREITLDGGRVIKYATVDGGVYNLVRLNQFKQDYTHSNVNFEEEGAYLVSIAKKRWYAYRPVYFQFTIQVVSPEAYKINPDAPGDDFYYEQLDPLDCENVTAVMIAPPDNIVYPVGYEGQIDPAGIVVRAAECWFSKRYEIAELDYTIESDVDFNVPGSYIVRVDYTDPKGKDYWFIFTVAVAQRAK